MVEEKRTNAFSSVVWGPPGFPRSNAFRKSEELVLVARAGFFNPGNDRHHDATLLAAHVAGAGAAKLMRKRSGHLEAVRRCTLQAACQARNYVLVGIAADCNSRQPKADY
jgi:hypothetical protein